MVARLGRLGWSGPDSQAGNRAPLDATARSVRRGRLRGPTVRKACVIADSRRQTGAHAGFPDSQSGRRQARISAGDAARHPLRSRHAGSRRTHGRHLRDHDPRGARQRAAPDRDHPRHRVCDPARRTGPPRPGRGGAARPSWQEVSATHSRRLLSARHVHASRLGRAPRREGSRRGAGSRVGEGGDSRYLLPEPAPFSLRM